MSLIKDGNSQANVLLKDGALESFSNENTKGEADRRISQVKGQRKREAFILCFFVSF